MDTKDNITRRTALATIGAFSSAVALTAAGIKAVAAKSASSDDGAAIVSDPVFAVIAEIAAISDHSNALLDELCEAEASAKADLGNRPSTLIAWRNYSAVGKGELAGCREDFLRRGADPALIEAEYLDAKDRCEAANARAVAWDDRAGIAALRAASEGSIREFRALLYTLAETKPTTMAGVLTYLDWLAKDIEAFDEDYQGTMVKTATAALRDIEKAVAK